MCGFPEGTEIIMSFNNGSAFETSDITREKSFLQLHRCLGWICQADAITEISKFINMSNILIA